MASAANYLDQIMIFAIFAVSLNLLLGYAGQVSVAHAAFGAIGGYTVGYLAIHAGWNPILAIPVGFGLALLTGIVLALPARSLSVEFLILLTLAVSSVLLGVITTFGQLGGTYGLIGIPSAQIGGARLSTPTAWFLPLLLIMALSYAICWRFGESAYGRVLRGIREDGDATQSLGKNVSRAKVTVFGVSCGLAGLAGGCLAAFNLIAAPSQYGFDVSLSIFAMVIFGGMGNLLGSVIGAAVVVLTKPLLEWSVHIAPETAGLWRLAIYGAVLVVLMRLRPRGVLPEGRRVRDLFRRQPASSAGPSDAIPSAIARTAEAWEREAERVFTGGEQDQREKRRIREPVVLEVRGLSKSFGGIVAARNLDMDLHRGTITALVGPNGAGKTTVFNLLTGFIAPDSGSVRLNGEQLVGLRPDIVAGRGLVRSWQDVRIIPRLTSLENVMLGVQDQAGENLSPLFLHPAKVALHERRTREKALHALEFVGMTEFASMPAGGLSFGQSKLVALARVLATDAPVLLLDEPTSGIDTQWVDAMLELVERIRDEGRTVCIVEHNLHVVGRLADHTYFMQLGSITDEGTLDELTRSERLSEAYFGTV